MRPGTTLERSPVEISIEPSAMEERSIPQGEGLLRYPARGDAGAVFVGKTGPVLFKPLRGRRAASDHSLRCRNTAQLQLAQLQRRRRELPSCAASLARQSAESGIGLVAEVVFLAASAGLLGTGLAWIGMQLVRARRDTLAPTTDRYVVGLAYGLLAVGCATVAAALFGGVLPALVAWRDVAGRYTAAAGAGLAGGSAPARTRRVKIVAELTLFRRPRGARV